MDKKALFLGGKSRSRRSRVGLMNASAVLDHAADLMVEYDPGYQIHRLPLYPLFHEIWYWLTKQTPK